jgi:uncharacterized protein (TIGR02757 family)
VDTRLKDFFDRKVAEYNTPSFIADDPISIPHQFHLKQDIEIAGFFAALFAWGNRTTIIKKTAALMQLMDNEPYQFCLKSNPRALRKLADFKHRTFNATDLYYFILFLNHHYRRHESLESAFSQWSRPEDETVENALSGFHRYFFSLPDAPERTRKHIASPARGSTCKRLNMFLRWMVRKDQHGVDFGIWNSLSPAQLICPIDLHVARVAKRFQLITRKQVDWLTALELTAQLKRLDKEDPAKYDFALFGLGVVERF